MECYQKEQSGTLRDKRKEKLSRAMEKIYWDWEHKMRTSCTARRPDLTLKDSEKREIILLDMACPNESNKIVKRDEIGRASCRERV